MAAAPLALAQRALRRPDRAALRFGMAGFQRFLFRTVLRPLLAIVGGLVLIALLPPGLPQIDLIINNRQSLLVYLWVSLLAAPQIISLLMPVALFVATTGALSVAHR